MKILVIDIGGSKVKFTVWGKRTRRRFFSGETLTPDLLVSRILARTPDWKFDVISIGFPGLVVHGKIARDNQQLAKGWVGFDFEKAFKKPVKVINDAAMQALGSYKGGRMLFVGLGTGVGSTLILDSVVVPLELGELWFSKKRTLSGIIGKPGLKRMGREKWEESVRRVIPRLAAAFGAETVTIGGGNAKKMTRLPRCAVRGSNDNAFLGGARLWGGGPMKAKMRKHTLVIT